MKPSHPVCPSSVLLGVAFLLSAQAFGQQKTVPQTDGIVVLHQEMFARSAPGTNFVGQGWLIVTQEGKTLSPDRLPVKAKLAFMDMGRRILPRVELKDATPLDAIQLVLEALQERKPPSLGLIAEPRDIAELPDWLRNAALPNGRIQCELSNVSLLDFAGRLAESLGCHLALSEDGSVLYRAKNAEPPFERRMYLLKTR